MPITDDTTVTFYDPHPGFGGATVPIPLAVKRVADELNGQTMLLSEALDRIRAVTDGAVFPVLPHQYIALRILDSGPRWIEHGFRVIRYTDRERNDESKT